MPWTGPPGSQTFERTDGTRSGTQVWQQANAASVKIVDSDHDLHDQDIADGFNACLKKDGGNTATANIPMGGFKLTNVGAATSVTDSASMASAQKAGYIPSVSGTNDLTLTTGLSVGVYAAGQRFNFIVANNSTGAVTLNVDGLGVKALVRNDASHTALAAGDLQAGAIAEALYDGTRFKLVSSSVAGVSSDVLARIVKVGSVLQWPMTAVPAGWLEADGSAVSRTTYAELFAAYGTAYGAGDGSTTFNIPNYKDQFLRGFDAAGTDASTRTNRGDGTVGANVGTKQGSALLRHNHVASVTDPGHRHGIGGSGAAFADDGIAIAAFVAASGLTETATTGISVTIANTSANDSVNETRPKNITVKFIILALPAAASASTIGVNGLLYSWDAGTADADPGAGKLRVNNATISSATELYINETGANSESLSAVLATWDDSTSAVKGTLYIYKVGAPGTYAYFQIAGSITDAGTYDKFSLTYVGHNNTFAAGDNLSVLFIRNGDRGARGDAGFAYTFDSATTMADPGTGEIRFNDASLASATAIAINDATAESGNPDVSAVILTWDDSASAIRGTLTIQNTSAPENFAVYSITGASTDNTGWIELAVTYVSSSGSFTAGDLLSVLFSRTGDLGETGTTPATQFTFDSSTADSDPGSGNWRFNNATLSSVTAAYIDNADSDGNTITGWLDSFDDTNDTSRRGVIEFRDVSAPSTFAKYQVTGSVVDGTGYRKLTLSHLASAGAFSGRAAVTFAPAGNKGADGIGAGDVIGPASATDDGFARFDGTTGKLLKDSSATIAIANGGTGQTAAAAAFDALSPTTTRGDIIFRNATINTRLAASTAGYFLQTNGAGTDPSWAPPPGLPRGYLSGLTLSNDGTDPTNDIGISDGVARDSSNTADLNLASALVKRLDANWAAGTNQGMRNSAAAIADGTYHIYVVGKALGADTDIYAHTSATPATVLAALQAESGGASYLYVRRVWSIRRESGAIRLFNQYGDYCKWRAQAVDRNDITPVSNTLLTITVPTGIQVIADLQVDQLQATVGNANQVLGDGNDIACDQLVTRTALASAYSLAPCSDLITNTSGQILHTLAVGSGTISSARVMCNGYWDGRGQ